MGTISQRHDRGAGNDSLPDRHPSRLLAYLRSDHMVRNSLYLVLNSGTQAVLGFAFWILTARLFSTEDVGRASSLISAAMLIGFLALLGLNTTFVRYLPRVPDPDKLISAGFFLVSIFAATMALIYVTCSPLVAPRIAFVAHRPWQAAGFIVLTAVGAMNVLTDSVFIAAGKTNYNVLTDGVAGGLTRVISVVIVVGTGSYGIFCASSVGAMAAALASLLLMLTALQWRPKIGGLIRALRPMLRFSGANYAANVLNLTPSLVVPLIVLDRIGASAAAYFFVSYQLATVLYSAVYAVENTFLAEGSYMGKIRRDLVRRSIRTLVALCIPACILVILAGHWLLLTFGKKYGNHAEGCLIMLTVAVLPIAADNWLLTVLRLSNRLKAIVLSNIIYASSICGLAWVLAPHGVTAVAAAWPIGVSVGAAPAAFAAAGALPRGSPARHRR
jgi:O-antigen/teichoic acid export membrane protein